VTYDLADLELFVASMKRRHTSESAPNTKSLLGSAGGSRTTMHRVSELFNDGIMPDMCDPAVRKGNHIERRNINVKKSR
jgi:hypothetical protein